MSFLQVFLHNLFVLYESLFFVLEVINFIILKFVLDGINPLNMLL